MSDPQAENMQHEIKTRLQGFQQMGRHDLEAYLLMAAPDESTEEGIDEVEEATFRLMIQRLKATPFEFLTASDAYYFFMRKTFQTAEAHLWKHVWRNEDMNQSTHTERLKVLDAWLEETGHVEDELVGAFEGDATLNEYRQGGESYPIPAHKMLKIAIAVRRSLLNYAEKHGVRAYFDSLPADPTPED